MAGIAPSLVICRYCTIDFDTDLSLRIRNPSSRRRRARSPLKSLAVSLSLRSDQPLELISWGPAHRWGERIGLWPSRCQLFQRVEDHLPADSPEYINRREGEVISTAIQGFEDHQYRCCSPQCSSNTPRRDSEKPHAAKERRQLAKELR
jgi:hypothetical protein